METTIPLRRLTGVHLVGSLLLVQFLCFTCAGCPAPSSHYLCDAFAENAFLASFADNRAPIRLHYWITATETVSTSTQISPDKVQDMAERRAIRASAVFAARSPAFPPVGLPR